MTIGDKDDHCDRQYANHLRDQEEQESKKQRAMDQEARDYQEQEAWQDIERDRRAYELLEREKDGNLSHEERQELVEREKEDPEKIEGFRDIVN